MSLTADDTKKQYLEEGGISDGENSLEPAYMVDHKAERSLCRKFDFRLLPVLAVMCKPFHPGFYIFWFYSSHQ